MLVDDSGWIFEIWRIFEAQTATPKKHSVNPSEEKFDEEPPMAYRWGYDGDIPWKFTV